MAYRLETSWDVASLASGGLLIKVTDGGGTSEVSFTTGVYTHSDISAVDADFSPFAAALKAALDADATLTSTYTVTWGGASGYTISATGATLSLTFTGTTDDTQAAAMRRLLGYSGNQTGATAYTSDVRPYYLVIPSIAGRSQYTREREVAAIVDEAVADDGSSVFISKTVADKVGDWLHVAEIETTPAIWKNAGTPTHASMVDAGTSANDVPWSWEHFYEHIRTHHHRIHVLDGSDSEVWECRAGGLHFDPTRWSGADQPLWQVPFRGRLIGRL